MATITVKIAVIVFSYELFHDTENIWIKILNFTLIFR